MNASWPSPTASGDRPVPASGQPRTTRIYRIAEMMLRYSACERGGKHRIFDRETNDVLVPEYDSEDLARAGARLQAAYDIDELYDGARK